MNPRGRQEATSPSGCRWPIKGLQENTVLCDPCSAVRGTRDAWGVRNRHLSAKRRFGPSNTRPDGESSFAAVASAVRTHQSRLRPQPRSTNGGQGAHRPRSHAYSINDNNIIQPITRMAEPHQTMKTMCWTMLLSADAACTPWQDDDTCFAPHSQTAPRTPHGTCVH